MKEIDKISISSKEICGNFEYQWYEPLLEYVGIIADNYHPPYTAEDGYIVSSATNDFAKKYLREAVNVGSINKYIENKEIQQTIKAMGYDRDKFWYLLMFILDYSRGYCVYGLKINESPKEQLEKLADTIIENISSIEDYTGNPIFKNPAKLSLNTSKNNNTSVDNQLALTWLALIIKEGIESIEEGSKLSTSITELKIINGQLEKNNLEKDGFTISYFANMFLKFFELKPPIIQIKKGSDNASKLLLISRLVFITGLTDNISYLVTDDNLKKNLKLYRNFKPNMMNGFYLWLI